MRIEGECHVVGKCMSSLSSWMQKNNNTTPRMTSSPLPKVKYQLKYFTTKVPRKVLVKYFTWKSSQLSLN